MKSNYPEEKRGTL